MNKNLGLITAIIVSIPLLLVISCSSQKQAGPGSSGQTGPEGGASPAAEDRQNQAADAGYPVQIVPVEATRNTVMTANIMGVNASGGRTEWLINDDPVPGAEGRTFKAENVKKGDKVQARFLANGREYLSNTVEIHNAAPQFTRVKLMPEVFRPGDLLSIDVAASDVDGDEVTVLYEWTKNGEPAGNGSQIEGQIRRGDKISVRVVPFDGELQGEPVVLNREIVNVPPMINAEKGARFDGKVWTCRLDGEDPDGDPLTYSLKNAPSGMTIDPSTGLITWNVPPDFEGKISVIAAAADGHGGEATQVLNITIR